MTSAQIIILLTIAAYLVAMVLVGVYFSRKGSGDNSHEFYLGGRRLGPIVTAMSAEASDMSSYLLMGLPGPGLFMRRGRGGLDCHRPGGGYVFELADRCKTHPPLFRRAGRHHHSGFLLPALSG